MNPYTVDGFVKNGHLEINNIPLPDNSHVHIIVVPKVNLAKASFKKIKALTKTLQGKLSDDIAEERDSR
ncbi:hypothetical protein QUF75_14985 [Desulfococcaceae bacterium HSG7]|nr:hypothetical protein [Desulfococcaceae bacterium HSG7]